MKITAQENIVGCRTDSDLRALNGIVVQEYLEAPKDSEPDEIMKRFIGDHPECRDAGWRYEITQE